MIVSGCPREPCHAEALGEWILSRIPVVRTLYSSVKQVSDTILSPHGQAFRKALLVEYPRRGCWTLGFLTGAPSAAMQAKMGVSSGQEEDTMVSVFVPTTPNPTSGFFLMMRREETVELDMSVDAALKYIVSMGGWHPRSAGTKLKPIMNEAAGRVGRSVRSGRRNP